MTASTTRWIHWLRLVRLPNLFTAPGDPFAGFVLASGLSAVPTAQAGASGALDTRMVWAGLSAMALYAGGLVMNDVADYESDCRERPNRPLPCGAVTRRDALIAGLLMGASGVAVAALAGMVIMITAGCLFLLILVYDFLTPRGSVTGMLVMGLCRSASVGLGIAASGNLSWNRGIPWFAAAGTGLYIVAVSRIAAGETRSQRLGWKRWVPLMILAVTFWSLVWIIGVVLWSGAALATLSLFTTWNLGRRLGPEPEPEAVPASIAGYIRTLILVQASYCAMAPGWGGTTAMILLCLWPLSKIMAKRFYAS